MEDLEKYDYGPSDVGLGFSKIAKRDQDRMAECPHCQNLISVARAVSKHACPYGSVAL